MSLAASPQTKAGTNHSEPVRLAKAVAAGNTPAGLCRCTGHGTIHAPVEVESPGPPQPHSAACPSRPPSSAGGFGQQEYDVTGASPGQCFGFAGPSETRRAAVGPR